MTKAKPKWLSPYLMQGPEIMLCLNQSDYDKAMAELGIEYHRYGDYSTCVHAMCEKWQLDNDFSCVVSVSEAFQNEWPISDVLAALVHEAVHVWQYYAASIGEHKPSSEFEAYSIEAISKRLFDAYKEQKGL